MKEYTYAFKARVVREYQRGEASYEDLANKHHITSPSLVEIWVSKVKNSGFEALHVDWNKKYPAGFKAGVVDYYLYSGLSQNVTAMFFGIDATSLSSWTKAYRSKGVEGLKTKRERRQSSMKKHPRPATEKERNLQEIQNLKDELYNVKMERDVLKKLIAVTHKNHSTETKQK